MLPALSGLKSWLSGSSGRDGRRDGTSDQTAHPTRTTADHATTSVQPQENSPMNAAAGPRCLPSAGHDSLLRDITHNSDKIHSDRRGSHSPSDIGVDESSLRSGLIPGRKDRKRSSASPVATRRLGGLTGSKKDGQITIPDPMKEEMERRTKFANKHLGGVRPVNTLDAPSTKPVNSRARFLAQTKAQSVYESGEANKAAVMKRNDHSHAIKKQRTGPSPKDGKQVSPIEVDDSQEFQGFHDQVPEIPKLSVPAQPTQQKGQFKGVEIPRSHQKNGIHAKRRHADPQQLAAIDHILSREQKQAMAGRDHSQLSHDELLMGEPLSYGDSGEDGVAFVRAAAKKRKADHKSSPRLSTAGVPAHQTIEHLDLAIVSRTAPSPYLTGGRLPEAESPDPIQQSGSNQRSQKQYGGTPLSQQPDLDLSHSIAGNRNNRKLTQPQNEAAKSSSRGRANVLSWHVVDVAGFFIARPMDFYDFYIDLDEVDFWFDKPKPQLDVGPVMTARPIKKIQIIQHGDKSSKVFIKLSHSQNTASNTFVMELRSRKKVNDLIQTVQYLDDTIKVRQREDRWLDDAFKKQVEDSTEWNLSLQRCQVDDPRSNLITASVSSEYFTSRSGNGNRVKLTDELDGPRNKTAEQAVARPEDRQNTTENIFDKRSLPEQYDGDEWGIDASSDDVRSQYFSRKATRSQTLRSANLVETPKPRSPTPKLKYSQSVGLGPRWANDLVYPKEGKKRETVEYGDLLRLDEDEFLNDVLVGFFARYVQHDLELHNPPLLRNIHFFNSYFFDTLTKNSKAKKDINHSAVARWTKNIDIFNRDFVVVPVNDNLHWYLAIICNLRRLTRKNQDDEEAFVDETKEGDDSVQIVEDGNISSKENTVDDAEQGQRTQQTQKSFQDLTLDDEFGIHLSQTEPKQSSETELGSSLTKPKPGRRKKTKIRKSLPKYDTETPIIITLDSLAQPRSAAIAALKQYVVLEAKAKRNVEIEKEDIKGMTAKGIPNQGNYSDCGLFMCMYLEQFMADPYGFVKKILQREEGNLRWPKTIRSERLRTRLRDLITELHHRQEGGEPEKPIPPLGKIMVEMRETSPEAVPSTPPRLSRSRTNSSNLDDLDGRHIHQARQRLRQVNDEAENEMRHLNPEGHPVTKEGSLPISSASQKRTLEEALYQVDHDPLTASNLHESILINDYSQAKRAKKLRQPPLTMNLPSVKTQRPVNRIGSSKRSGPPVHEDTVKTIQHSDPQDLANQMREARGSPAQRTRAKMASPMKTHVRTDSASTDFLSGIHSYANHAYDSQEEEVNSAAKDVSKSELGGEIPETQELDVEDVVARESRQLRTQTEKGDSQEEMLV